MTEIKLLEPGLYISRPRMVGGDDMQEANYNILRQRLEYAGLSHITPKQLNTGIETGFKGWDLDDVLRVTSLGVSMAEGN